MIDYFRSKINTIGLIKSFVIILLCLLVNITGSAQEKPPRPVAVNLSQNLSFGAFFLGTIGGTVTINPYGMRYSTGDIILYTMGGWVYFPAHFEIEGNAGTVVHLQVIRLNPPSYDAELSGSNGGFLWLIVGNAVPGDPIIITTNPPGQTQVSIGGTLIVSSSGANPPGTYSGTFEVLFSQE